MQQSYFSPHKIKKYLLRNENLRDYNNNHNICYIFIVMAIFEDVNMKIQAKIYRLFQ